MTTVSQLVVDLELAAQKLWGHPELQIRFYTHIESLRIVNHYLTRHHMATLDVVQIITAAEARITAAQADAASQKSRADRAEAQVAADQANLLTPDQLAALTKLDQDNQAAAAAAPVTTTPTETPVDTTAPETPAAPSA